MAGDAPECRTCRWSATQPDLLGGPAQELCTHPRLELRVQLDRSEAWVTRIPRQDDVRAEGGKCGPQGALHTAGQTATAHA